MSPAPAISKSTIVSQMDNYYEENPELSIDPCHDTFIHDMESLGYELAASVVLPAGQKYFQYWIASCPYKSGDFSALTASTTAPFMMPDETLTPTDNTSGPSHLIEIAGRPSIVRPPAGLGVSCSVSMTTTFGSMNITGGDHRNPDGDADCARIVDLLEQIEPWIND
ncbi:hypothetical protein [Tomitella biformata]|uniref:hypothetical protein n=1 Tax=Tomitella biformata TaxID=630403 RepID=UPI0004637935